ncbi:MAG: hypothetical protein A2Z20_11945 [Bdellovibrionales bacterium RBG_16_40_8]|nr:MAG: hypothetical protein A2Z20_11945 [Bdellovibrionales bacterium RBG_16_40_8]
MLRLVLILSTITYLQRANATSPSASSIEDLTYIDKSFFQKKPELIWGRDPFLKLPGYILGETTDQKYKLEALIYSKDSPQAIINKQIVKRGSVLKDGAIVENIGPTFVVIRDGVNLKQLVVKKRSPAKQ